VLWVKLAGMVPTWFQVAPPSSLCMTATGRMKGASSTSEYIVRGADGAITKLATAPVRNVQVAAPSVLLYREPRSLAKA
jgi:hypothetical protein